VSITLPVRRWVSADISSLFLCAAFWRISRTAADVRGAGGGELCAPISLWTRGGESIRTFLDEGNPRFKGFFLTLHVLLDVTGRRGAGSMVGRVPLTFSSYIANLVAEKFPTES